VKTRRRASDLDLAIDAQRLRRVRTAAIALADHYARADDAIQIDVILIAPFTLPRHLSNVSHG
jgi:putative endonuclease